MKMLRVIKRQVIGRLALFSESRGTALLETVIALTIFGALGTAVLMGVRAATFPAISLREIP